MTRPTPFELVFRELVADLAPLRAAAERAGRNARERADFAQVAEVQRLLGRLAPPDVVARDTDAGAEYLALLYAAYRYWEAGERVLVVERSRLRAALDLLPPGRPPRVPAGACYLQVPPSWFWAQATPAGPHEPLDGCFVIEGGRGSEITVVAVLGLRPERGGFTQLTLHAVPQDFVEATGIRRDPPFAPLMDGGAAAGFHSLATPAEVLTLVHLALGTVAE